MRRNVKVLTMLAGAVFMLFAGFGSVGTLTAEEHPGYPYVEWFPPGGYECYFEGCQLHGGCAQCCDVPGC